MVAQPKLCMVAQPKYVKTCRKPVQFGYHLGFFFFFFGKSSVIVQIKFIKTEKFKPISVN